MSTPSEGTRDTREKDAAVDRQRVADIAYALWGVTEVENDGRAIRFDLRGTRYRATSRDYPECRYMVEEVDSPFLRGTHTATVMQMAMHSYDRDALRALPEGQTEQDDEPESVAGYVVLYDGDDMPKMVSTEPHTMEVARNIADGLSSVWVEGNYTVARVVPEDPQPKGGDDTAEHEGLGPDTVYYTNVGPPFVTAGGSEEATGPSETCDVYEYDGAFSCSRHLRRWGAITSPDFPCCLVDSKPGGGWHRGCPTVANAGRSVPGDVEPVAWAAMREGKCLEASEDLVGMRDFWDDQPATLVPLYLRATPEDKPEGETAHESESTWEKRWRALCFLTLEGDAWKTPDAPHVALKDMVAIEVAHPLTEAESAAHLTRRSLTGEAKP